MEFPVVVGVDGSDASLQAVDWAVEEAALHNRVLRIVYASLWERYEGFARSMDTEPSAGRAMAENILGVAEERAARRRPDVKVSRDLLAEEPVEALVYEGRSAFALVVGSHGRGELTEMLLGSVGLGVAGHASCTRDSTPRCGTDDSSPTGLKPSSCSPSASSSHRTRPAAHCTRPAPFSSPQADPALHPAQPQRPPQSRSGTLWIERPERALRCVTRGPPAPTHRSLLVKTLMASSGDLGTLCYRVSCKVSHKPRLSGACAEVSCRRSGQGHVEPPERIEGGLGTLTAFAQARCRLRSSAP
ncbi:universal stress protein [Actinacidiphila oryziradicis]|uniref:Universal stress protein n=1 Tax=Actinacidiphila oryziradicis TaxID=2571141 RepID=A0A4U0RTT8_9ACTN|nr:universal stress protein [Actinacidiphila oryziradicis]TJZ99581.1 universal stress protein [Actinacidiphila oryziradicis]